MPGAIAPATPTVDLSKTGDSLFTNAFVDNVLGTQDGFIRGDDPYILAMAAWALGLFGEDIATAIALVDRSLQLNPSFARGWFYSGTLRLWAGQYDLAIEHIETSIRLSPRQRRHYDYMTIGMGHFFCAPW
jgi:tetratricopeptide (TPR) repeat protein